MGKSWQRIFLTNLVSLLLTPLFLVVFPTCLFLFIPLYILRFFAKILAKLMRPDLGKLVQTRSAVFAATDDLCSDPKWVLCTWLVFEDQLDFDKVRTNFYRRIILKRDSNGELRSPEYQQYFAKWLGFVFWKWEQDFNITEHVRYLYPEEPEKLLEEDDLRQLIKNLTWRPFSPDKSPWEVLYAPKYGNGGNNSLLIFRVHHGFCDGFSILNLLTKEVNSISLERVATPKAPLSKGDLVKACQVILSWFACPFLFMKMLVQAMDTNAWHLSSEKLRRPLNMGFTSRIPLSKIKEIKRIHGVSFSAVIYSSLTGALRNMMLEVGKPVPEYMTTAVAVPIPNHPNKLRNHFIFSFLQLPTGLQNPVARLKKVERNIEALKRSPVPYFSFWLIPILGATVTSVMKLFSINPYSTVLTSNFPGPSTVAQFIADGGKHQVTDMSFSAGLGEGNVGIGFCILSYANGLRVVSSFDANILASDGVVDLFNEKITEELETLGCSLNSV